MLTLLYLIYFSLCFMHALWDDSSVFRCFSANKKLLNNAWKHQCGRSVFRNEKLNHMSKGSVSWHAPAGYSDLKIWEICAMTAWWERSGLAIARKSSLTSPSTCSGKQQRTSLYSSCKQSCSQWLHLNILINESSLHDKAHKTLKHKNSELFCLHVLSELSWMCVS